MGRCECDLDDMSVPENVESSLRRRGGMDGVVQALPSDDHIKKEVDLHKAMSDPNRIKILHILSLSECCPCVLKQMMGLADSKLSYHLSKLEGHGLVESYRQHNWRIYRITELGASCLI